MSLFPTPIQEENIVETELSKDGTAVRLVNPTAQEFLDVLRNLKTNRILASLPNSDEIVFTRKNGSEQFIIAMIPLNGTRVLKFLSIAEENTYHLLATPRTSTLLQRMNALLALANEPEFVDFSPIRSNILYPAAVMLMDWDWRDEEQWVSQPE